jgi:hypothetical protein
MWRSLLRPNAPFQETANRESSQELEWQEQLYDAAVCEAAQNDPDSAVTLLLSGFRGVSRARLGRVGQAINDWSKLASRLKIRRRSLLGGQAKVSGAGKDVEALAFDVCGDAIMEAFRRDPTRGRDTFYRQIDNIRIVRGTRTWSALMLCGVAEGLVARGELTDDVIWNSDKWASDRAWLDMAMKRRIEHVAFPFSEWLDDWRSPSANVPGDGGVMPATATKYLARNSMCACGSGKKVKKCCGA